MGHGSWFHLRDMGHSFVEGHGSWGSMVSSKGHRWDAHGEHGFVEGTSLDGARFGHDFPIFIDAIREYEILA